jgi:hypothetical protein
MLLFERAVAGLRPSVFSFVRVSFRYLHKLAFALSVTRGFGALTVYVKPARHVSANTKLNRNKAISLSSYLIAASVD